MLNFLPFSFYGSSDNATTSNSTDSNVIYIRRIVFAICLIVFVLAYYDIQLREKRIINGEEILVNEMQNNENIAGSDENILNSSTDDIEPPDLSIRDFRFIKSSINTAIAKIIQDWDIVNYPKFLYMINIPSSSWEIQKQKFVELILNPHQKDFVVGFTGSSVTAGHDNYFHEAYPAIFETTFRPVLKTLNVTLQVRNQALGNNPCYPYDACLDTHVGDDLDILTWEQSMNCGRDSKPVESFIRAAANMPKLPTVMFLLSGTPVWSSGDCFKPTTTTTTTSTSAANHLYHHHHHHHNLIRRNTLDAKTNTNNTNAGVVEKTLNDIDNQNKNNVNDNVEENYIKNIHYYRNISSGQNMFANMTFLKYTLSKGVTANLIDYYSSLAYFGQNVLLAEEYKCQGPYDSNFTARSTGSTGSTWHPGVKGHKLRADSLAFYLLIILKDAIETLEKVYYPEDKSLVRKFKEENTAKLKQHRQNLVQLPPKSCSSETCKTSPSCYTNYEPRIKNSLTDIIVGTHNWSVELAWTDKKAVEKGIKNQLGYLDRKYIYMSSGLTPLSFLIQPNQTSVLWLCELQKGFGKYPASMGDLDSAATVTIDLNVVLNTDKKDSFIPKRESPLSLKLSADYCYESTTPIPAGQHVITLSQRTEQQQNDGQHGRSDSTHTLHSGDFYRRSLFIVV